MKFFSAILASLVATSALGFAPSAPTTRSSSTALQFSVKKDEEIRRTVSSAFAAAFVAANIAAFPVFAMDEPMDFGATSTTQLVAGRSGGRSGGRASSGGYRSAPRSSSYRSYSSTTVIAPPSRPSVIIAPPSYGLGYSYNPLGGVATGYALGTLGNIGNSIQDARQENEIQRSRYELEQARMKEAELEGRLRALEQQQVPK